MKWKYGRYKLCRARGLAPRTGTQAQEQWYIAECTRLGFAPGTDNFDNCRLELNTRTKALNNMDMVRADQQPYRRCPLVRCSYKKIVLRHLIAVKSDNGKKMFQIQALKIAIVNSKPDKEPPHEKNFFCFPFLPFLRLSACTQPFS